MRFDIEFLLLYYKEELRRFHILTNVSNCTRKKLGDTPFLISYVITLSILTKLDISFIILIA